MYDFSYKNISKKSGSVRLALIGMSGVGKSFWSKRLERKGFRRFSCDDLIAKRLGFRLGNKDKSTLNLANWMGPPFSKDYIEAESLYLQIEEEVMDLICDELENSIIEDDPIVLDTTGSLIYLNKLLLKRLCKLVRIVHLNLPIQKHKELFETHRIDPKPLIWKGKFQPKENENHTKTLRRCFEELISFRNKKYTLISDCELDYSFHYCPKTKLDDFLDRVLK